MNSDGVPDRNLYPPDPGDWTAFEYEQFIGEKVDGYAHRQWFDLAGDALADHPPEHFADLQRAYLTGNNEQLGKLVADGIRTWLTTYAKSNY